MAETQVAAVGPWPKGMLPSLDPADVPLDALHYAVNVKFDEAGAIYRREGYAEEDSTIVGSHRYIEWRTQYAISIIVRGGTNTYVYRNLAASPSPTLDGPFTALGEYVQLNSEDVYQIHNNFSHAPQRLNWNSTGSAVTQTALTAATFTVADKVAGTPANQFPKALAGLTKHERVFVANLTYGGTYYPSRIHYSDLLLPEKWYGLDYVDVDPEVGGAILHLAEYGDGILIFKHSGIWLLSGASPDTFSLTKLSDRYGSTQRPAVDGADVYFIQDDDLIRFNGQSFENLTAHYRDMIYVATAVNVWHDRIYLGCSFSSEAPWYGVVGSGCLVFDKKHDRWEIDSRYIQDVLIVEDAAYGRTFLGIGNKAIQSTNWRAEGGADGDGDAGGGIYGYAETGLVAPGGGGVSHRIRRLDAVFGGPRLSESYGRVDVTLQRDYDATKETVSSVTPSATNRHVRLAGFGNERWAVCHLDVANYFGASFKLSHFEMVYTVGRRHRGVDV